MVTVTFIDQAGSRHIVVAPVGVSLMEAAVRNSIPGIDADCGGSCACATCHVVIDSECFAKAGPVSTSESDMLDFVPVRHHSSRLSCQIMLSNGLDGLIVHIPESQR